jgi:hypothetical protein
MSDFIVIGHGKIVHDIYICKQSIEEYLEKFPTSPCVNCMVLPMCFEVSKKSSRTMWMKAKWCPPLLEFVETHGKTTDYRHSL